MGVVPVVVAILVGLLAGLLALPVYVAFCFQGVDALGGQITIHWLFGLVCSRIRVPEVGKPLTEQRATPEAATVRARTAQRGGRAGVVAALRQAAFRQRVSRLVKDLVRAAHLRGLRLRIRLGLGDPADTGRLWAFFGPLTAVMQNLLDADLQIEPDFMDPVFEFEAEGRMLLIPLQILILVLGFALSPASLRVWRTLKGRHA